MAYDLDTADGIRKALKQPPNDLKVFVYKYGEYRPIEKIRTCYVILCKRSTGFEYYIEVSEDTKDAIQVMVIE